MDNAFCIFQSEAISKPVEGFSWPWMTIVLDGALAQAGMPGFAGMLDPTDLAAIQTYIARRSFEDFGRTVRQAANP